MKRLQTFLVLVASFVVPRASLAQARLPIESFVNTQTTAEVYVDPATGNWLWFDAFGARSAAFGLDLETTITGWVSVEDLQGGRSRVTVSMHSRNALCRGSWFDLAIPDAPEVPMFGRNVFEVADGAAPSLGDGLTHLVFTQPTGAALPTWRALTRGENGYALERLVATILCHGDLRAASGYPDGTLGDAQTTQTVILSTGVPGGCPPEQDADCAPAERIAFYPVGR